MRYEFHGSTGEYCPSEPVKRLGDYILANPEFLATFKQICEAVKPGPVKDPLTAMPMVLSILRQAECLFGQHTIGQLTEMIKGFLVSDLKDSGNTRGKLLEYLIFKKGPFSFVPSDAMQVFRRCRVLAWDGTVVGSEANMDLCFLIRSGNMGMLLKLELLECKTTLETFLQKSDSIKKLDHMRALVDCGICSQYVVGFATLSTVRNHLVDLLTTKGYGCLSVFAYDEVYGLLTTR